MTLSATATQIIHIIASMNMAESVTARIQCKDIDHAAFVIKSDYCRPQMTTKLSYVKVAGFTFAVEKGEILHSLCFDDSFKIYDLTNKALDEIESKF